MSIITFNQSKAIILKFDATSDNSIKPLFDIAPYTSNSGNVVAENVFIKNLKAYAKISSLGEVQLPDLGVEDSDMQKTQKILNVEWTSPRKQLNLFLSNTPEQWMPFGSVSLLNPSGYPYRFYSLQDIITDNLAIELGSNGQMGLALKDVGFGLLEGNDIVSIYASYIKEIVINTPAKITASVPFGILTGTASIPILQSNQNRKYVLITNAGSEKVWFNLGVESVADQGLFLAPNGGTFELFIEQIPYFGTISAIADGTNNLITGIEAV